MPEGLETEEPLIVMEFGAEEGGLVGKSERKISQAFLDYAYNFQVENGNIIFCHVFGSGKRVAVKFIEIFF